MASERRIEQLNTLLREELSKILDRDMEFPSGTLVTITRVDISRRVLDATIFVSILGSAVEETWEMLNKQIYFIQKTLNRSMQIRPVPKIRFEIDREELFREGVERSLSELEKKGEL